MAWIRVKVRVRISETIWVGIRLVEEKLTSPKLKI